MPSNSSSPKSSLDKLRKEIIRDSFARFRRDFSIEDNPLSCIPGLNSELAQTLYEQIEPISIEKYDQRQQQKHTVTATPIIFIVDVLKHLEQMCSLLCNEELLEDPEEVSPLWNKIYAITKYALPFFENQSENYAFLSSEKLALSIREQSTSTVTTDDLKEQIRLSIHGMKTQHYIYLSLIEPIVHKPTEESRHAIDNLMKIKTIVFNAFLVKPFYCNFNSTISSALRDLHENELTELVIENSYENTEDFQIDLSANASRINTKKGAKLRQTLLLIINLLKRFNKKTKRKPPGSGSGGKSGSRTQHLPWIDIELNESLIQIDSSDPENPISIINSVSAVEQEELEDSPTEEHIKDTYVQDSNEGNTIPEVRVLNRTAQIQQIEKNNQFLKDELTPHELEQIIKKLEKTAAKTGVSEETLRISILITISLFSSYNLTQSHYLRWLAKRKRINTSYINLSEDCSSIFIPTPIYSKYRSSESKSLYLDNQNGMVELQVPTRFQAILLGLLTQYYEKENTKTGSVIRNHISANVINKVIKSYKLDSRVTLGLIQNNFAKKALFFANGDLWATSAISGREDVTSSTQKHYTTVELPYLQDAYRKSIKHLFDEDLPLSKKPNVKRFLANGDSFRPKKYKAVSFLNRLSQAIQETRFEHENKNWSIESVIQILNLSMIFMETRQSYITGARNVKNPFISPHQLDSENFYTVNDKNINNGYTTRLGYLPAGLITELENFMAFTDLLLKKLRKHPNFRKSDIEKINPPETWNNALLTSKRGHTFPGFFLVHYRQEKKTFHFKPYTRLQAAKTALAILGKDAAEFSRLQPNANRHFFRSTLIERGLNPEYIDELMGHRHLGTETWNPRCLFNPKDFRKEVKRVIDLTYKEFVSDSPFKEAISHV